MIWSDKRPITGRSVLFMMVGFFGVIMAVNGVFIYSAVTSWSGLSTNDAYRKGLDYNEKLAAAASQKSRGWTAVATFKLREARNGRIQVVFKNRRGQGIEQLDVAGVLTRPAQSEWDQVIVLSGMGGGVYITDIDLPLDGVWDMTIIARRDGAPAFQLEQRLWLEPQ
jgi:nitrogen fixation protein FixH